MLNDKLVVIQSHQIPFLFFRSLSSVTTSQKNRLTNVRVGCEDFCVFSIHIYSQLMAYKSSIESRILFNIPQKSRDNFTKKIQTSLMSCEFTVEISSYS